MAGEFVVTPESPRATVDFAQIAVTGQDERKGNNATGGEDVGDPYRYRILATGPSGQVLRSHEFTVSTDGDHVWDNVAFDEAGSWTLDLVDTEDSDAVVDTDSLTVASAD